MSDLEIEVTAGRIRAIPAVNLAASQILLAGPGELMGWSFRESGAETGLQAEGQVVSPIANQGIVSLPNVPAGIYNVSWEVQLIGAAAAADQDNFALVNGFAVLSNSLNAGAAGQYPQTPAQATVPAVQTVFIKAIAAGTVGVTYAAQIALTPVTAGQAILELQDGGQVLAEITAGIAGSLSQWYGPEGIRFYNQILAVPISGKMVGAVYARFSRAYDDT